MSFTDLKGGQIACASTFDRSIAVVAGAGSGKTFTLRERVARAFEAHPESGQPEPVVDEIGQVMAITFTEKAAAELRSRIKAALREAGRADQALLVDDAWIGTIHGVCSRILRENAFDLGLDPAFQIVPDDEREMLRRQTIDEALAGISVSREAVQALFEEYKPAAVVASVAALMDLGAESPGGVGALLMPGPPELRSLQQRVEDELGIHSRVALPQGLPNPCAGACWRGAGCGLDAGEAGGAGDADAGVGAGASDARACDAGAAAGEGAFGVGVDAGVDAGAGTGTDSGTGTGTGVGTAMRAWHLAVGELLEEALHSDTRAADAGGRGGRGKSHPVSTQLFLDLELALVWPCQDVFLALAADAARRFDELKLAAGMLDQNDLLVKTAAAFTRPEIAARYADRFRLVMVDEFQDTDPLQLSIVERLAGPQMRRLCVVGDPQQSIYRFRGAEVGTYRRHVDALPDDSRIALDDNYRSHADVLDFTDLLFTDGAGRPIGAYQRLNARRDESRPRFDEAAEGPRISVLDLRYHYGGKGALLRREAELVAQRFEQIHAASGRSYGDMAILLGAMTNVGEFAAALQRRNIPYVVAKGSVLNKMPEAKAVVQLARAIASREDGEAGFNVQECPLFGLEPGDFVEMRLGGAGAAGGAGTSGMAGEGGGAGASGAAGEGGGAEASGAAGEGAASDGDDARTARPAAGELSERAQAARRVLARARRDIGTRPLSELLARVLFESGWVGRLEADSAAHPAWRAANHARLANALKVVRMAEAIEAERCCGAASVASALETRMEELREAPGALSAKDSNFVRIMTIHASKGLQFPVVAVAEFAGSGGGAGASRIVSERVADADGQVRSCAVLDPGLSADRFESLWKCRATKEMLALAACEEEGISEERTRRYIWPEGQQVADPAQFRAALVAHADAADAAELERRLYVAFTRAEEALVVCMHELANKKTGKLTVPPGVQQRILEHEAEIAARWEYRIEELWTDAADAAGEGDAGADGTTGAGKDGAAAAAAAPAGVADEAGDTAGESAAGTARADAAGGDTCAGDAGGEGEAGGPVFAVPCELPRPPRCDWRYAPAPDANIFSASSILAAAQERVAAAGGVVQEQTAAAGTEDAGAAGGAVQEQAAAAGDGNVDATGTGDAAGDGAAGAADDGGLGTAAAAGAAAAGGDHVPCAADAAAAAPAGAAGAATADAGAALEADAGAAGADALGAGEQEEDGFAAPGTARGTAFHVCAQLAALRAGGGRPISPLPDERLEAIAAGCGLETEAELDELRRRMKRWTGSELAAQMAAHAHLVPELPFFIRLDDPAGLGATPAAEGRPAYLRGFIDLLASDEPDSGTAWVVDYKTGYADMSPAERAEHFAIQAGCYARALLVRGFARVELSFVFVDDADGAGQPAVTRFSQAADGELSAV